jgi:trigger factor
MKVHIEEITPIKKKLIIEIEADQTEAQWQAVVKDLGKKTKMKGFRPGKIPLSVLTKYYGPQIEEEVVSNLINQAYPEALKETGLRPVALPEVERPSFHKDTPYSFQAVIEIKPEISLSAEDYRGLTLKKEEAAVSDEEVEKRLALIQKTHGELLPLSEKRPLQEGDFAVIAYNSFLEGKPLPGGAASNFDIEVGANYFNTQFEKELLGLEPGEGKEFDIAFPEDSENPAIAGKTVHYQVTLQEIKVRNLPDLNDQFAQHLGKEFQSLEDLKKKIQEDLELEAKRRADGKTREDLINQLLAKTQFELPEALVNQEIHQMLARIEQDLSRQGLDWEKAGLEPARLMEKFTTPAQKQVQKQLLLEKIAQMESLTVPSEELEAELAAIAAKVNQSLTLVKEIYNKNNMLPYLEEKLLEEKTLNFIREHAIIQG